MQLLRPGGTEKEKAHRWYRLAFVAAIVMFILLAPEVNNGKYMDPTISDGQVLVTSKTAFSTNRGMPDRGQLVILKKPFSQEAGADDNITTPNGIEGCKDEVTKVKIKEGKVFVLCDNRNTKLKFDSRNEDIGVMSAKEIKGKVLLRAWPPGKLK